MVTRKVTFSYLKINENLKCATLMFDAKKILDSYIYCLKSYKIYKIKLIKLSLSITSPCPKLRKAYPVSLLFTKHLYVPIQH